MDLKNRIGGCGLDSSGLEWGSPAGFCEHGNDPSGSINPGDFLSSRATTIFRKRTQLPLCSQYSGQESSPTPPEYEPVKLTVQTRCSVTSPNKG
jgi:hypothetical protein